MRFPQRMDKKPDGNFVECAEHGEEGYAENIEYSMQISFHDESALINYYGEDGSYLGDEEIIKMLIQYNG